MSQMNTVQVIDKLNVTGDATMPTLSQLLDPTVMQAWLDTNNTTLANQENTVRLQSIEVMRFKPGLRCVIEYGTQLEKVNATSENVKLVGKASAIGTRGTAWKIEQALWKNGFDDTSADGISIPEPVGRCKQLKISFQKKIDGQEIWPLLLSNDGEHWAKRVADAAHKIHQSGVPSKRTHTMADELRILHERVLKVAQQKPVWRHRIENILAASDRLGARLPETALCTSHRDYYHDQIIIRGERLFVLDLDLYCYADEGLDIGNFIAHITERSLCKFNDPTALSHLERCIEDHFVELTGEHVRQAVQTYATLTLVRHIFISTRFDERRHYTEDLLGLCEQRLAQADV